MGRNLLQSDPRNIEPRYLCSDSKSCLLVGYETQIIESSEREKKHRDSLIVGLDLGSVEYSLLSMRSSRSLRRLGLGTTQATELARLVSKSLRLCKFVDPLEVGLKLDVPCMKFQCGLFQPIQWIQVASYHQQLSMSLYLISSYQEH